jgi:predicted GNAT superfamily acetyltransferase
MKRKDRLNVLNDYISRQFSVHKKDRNLQVSFQNESAFDSSNFLQYIVRHENNDADYSIG